MDRTNVKSSSIRSIGYDAKNEILEIEFNNGGVYQYFGVPQQLENQLMAAASKGQFFDQKIKNKYRTVKLR